MTTFVFTFYFDFQMASLKPSKDQLNRKFAVDDIPRIDVYSERKTLNSTLEAINSILQHGESHLKLECVERIMYGGYIDDPKQAKKYTKAVIKTKVLGWYSSIVKYFLDLLPFMNLHQNEYDFVG